MKKICGIILFIIFFFGSSSVALETRDLKSADVLEKMESVWGALSLFLGNAPGLVNQWGVSEIEDPVSGKMRTVAAVKNSSGDILYLVKQKNQEVIMTFVSSVKILYLPPFDVYVDKKHIFNVHDKNMLPVMSASSGLYSGFTFYLNKDYENPSKNTALKTFLRGKQAVFEFLTEKNEVGQAVFSLKGSRVAITKVVFSE